MSLAMSSALSALTAAQRIAETASHNIANANTPGYSRQEAVLRPALPIRTTAGMMGTGVTIERIHAIRDDFLALRINQQATNLGYSESMHNALSELENIIMPGPDTGIGMAIDDFFKAVNDLVNNPQSEVSREGLVQSATMLCETFQTMNQQLRQLQQHVTADFNQNISEVNSTLTEIAGLNGRIMAVAEGTDVANDLVDQRNIQLERLSRLIPVTVTEERGVANILFEGRLLVSGTSRLTLQSDGSGGAMKFGIAGSSDTFQTDSGTLGAQADLINNVIPEYVDIIDDMARGLIREFNAIHSTGVGLANGYTTLSSVVELPDLDFDGIRGNEPLAEHSLTFPLEEGRLYITTTNEATGEISRGYIDYDPQVDSIYDLADRITAIPTMNASVSAGNITMNSWPGYRFDFSNKVFPDGGTLGTSNITISGAYTNNYDREFTFYPLNSGTVGQSEDLRVAVRDEQGSTISILQLGATYTPGSAIEVVDGISFSFGEGDLSIAEITSSQSPFALADGMTLTLEINGEPPADIIFSDTDFADIANATAEELAAVINNAGIAAQARIVDGAVVISPAQEGPDSSIEIGGDAAGVLGLDAGPTDTDAQSISILGESDTGGLLCGLSINAFFTGGGSGNIRVSDHVAANTDNIAAARTSPPGDNANAVRLAQLKQGKIFSNGNQTISEYHSFVIGKAGIDARQALNSYETQNTLVENLHRQRESVSGVSLEEEMAKLMQTQQMFHAAVKLINAVEEMLQQLTSL